MVEPKKLSEAVSGVRQRIGPPPSVVKIILFVCSGNICRSPMGEAYLIDQFKEKGIENIEVYSAGTLNISGQPADPKAVAVGMDAELDMRKHVSYGIVQLPVGVADIILTMEEKHRHTVIDTFPAADGKTYLLGDFSPDDPGAIVPDPIGASLEEFQQAFEMIRDCVDVFVEWLKSGSGD